MVNAGHITSGFGIAVYLAGGGVLTNQSGGYINGYFTGVRIHQTSGTATVVNQANATINSALHYGVLIYGGARGSVTNAGTITGRQTGVELPSGGTAINSGTHALIEGASGIVARNHQGTVVNSGTVEGTYGPAIALFAGGQVTNQAGGLVKGISGGTGDRGDGVYVHGVYIPGSGIVRGTYIDGSVTNAGTIQGVGSASNGVYLHGGGAVTNSGAAALIEGFTGVNVQVYAGAVTNSGTIYGTSFKTKFIDISGTGVFLRAGGSVTNTGSAALITGGTGVEVVGAAGTVVNSGDIFGSSSVVVYLGDGGSVTNTTSTAQIEGPGSNQYGIEIAGAAGAVDNAGVINGEIGVDLKAGGSVINRAGGRIVAGSTGVVLNGAGTVTDYGAIYGFGGTAVSLGSTGDELALGGGAYLDGHAVGSAGTLALLGQYGFYGSVSGLGTGTLTGSVHAKLTGFSTYVVTQNAYWTFTGINSVDTGDTLVDQGTMIVGSGGTLLNNGAIVDRSFLDVGSPLTNNGTVTVDNAILNTTTLGGTGTIEVVNHGAVRLLGPASGAKIDFVGTGVVELASGNTSGVTLRDFTAGDTIALSDIAYNASNTVAYNASLHEIIVSNSGHSQLAAIHTANVTIAAGDKLALVNGSQTDIVEQLLCFLKGTRIRTDAGEVAVENLTVGHRVVTLSGATRPITWIGTGRVQATRGKRNAATPVIVRRGALADGVPSRDLHVTKGHSLFIDDVLIPVEFLVNHHSILWDDWARQVEIYHVELDAHDVLIANGAPAESYRDDGNRWLFSNANTAWDAAPQKPCTSILTGGALVDRVWRRLLDRCSSRPGVPLTNDPDLHLLVDDRRIDAFKRRDDYYSFHLPARPSAVRLVSRAGAPQELGLARDPRALGVAIRRLMLAHGKRLRVMQADDPRLARGYHAFEPDAGIRWTVGDATVPPDLFADMTVAGMLAVELSGLTAYADNGETRRAR
jgi:hypothetical protein